MTLPASGPLKLSDIHGEFGGTGPLSEYYRGGARVPDVAPNSGIPTSGAISFSDFYGAQAVAITLANRLIEGLNSSGGLSTAQYRLESDGDITEQKTPNPHVDVGDWVVPKAAAGADYEVRITKQSGAASLVVGSEATWENLGTTRTYGISVTGGFADETYVGLIEIRPAGGGAVLGSATITLRAASSI